MALKTPEQNTARTEREKKPSARKFLARRRSRKSSGDEFVFSGKAHDNRSK